MPLNIWMSSSIYIPQCLLYIIRVSFFFFYLPYLVSCQFPPPASSPLSYNRYRTGRMKHNTCFLWDTWSQPCQPWFQTVALAEPQGRITHSEERDIFCIYGLTDAIVIDRGDRACHPSQRAWPVLLPWLQAMNDCGIFAIWTCDLLTIEWMVMEKIKDTLLVYVCLIIRSIALFIPECSKNRTSSWHYLKACMFLISRGLDYTHHCKWMNK